VVDEADAANPDPQRLPADEQTARDRHRRDHRGVLVDRLDIEAHGAPRRIDVASAGDADFARVRTMNPGQDLDQCRLARAVVADEADHFDRLDVEVRALQRVYTRVPLVSVAEGDQRLVHLKPSLSAASLCGEARCWRPRRRW
jgi:hypothetical protein